MTWINRVSSEFDVSSTDAGAKVFQEALDCFVSCLPKPSKRMPLAEAIGAKLNVSKIKVSLLLCEICLSAERRIDPEKVLLI